MKFLKPDDAFGTRAERPHLCFQRRESDAHIGRMRRDAAFAGAQNRVDAVVSVTCEAAASRKALVTETRGVIEIIATGALHQIAAAARHIAQLLRRTGEYGAGEQRIAPLDQRVVCELGVWN